jgi:hypothetical protein
VTEVGLPAVEQIGRSPPRSRWRRGAVANSRDGSGSFLGDEECDGGFVLGWGSVGEAAHMEVADGSAGERRGKARWWSGSFSRTWGTR